ncbi:glycoside hydrolase family 15 protein [Nocardioides islandensis]|uniref:glycoside hydrolase family 15 protein n=1 Tax=Nocardioides islandensis TaxID=433663 RepID=UPI002B26F935|nr:glycoside hydrolase family 15 protein [Nocardioides islandensis]
MRDGQPLDLVLEIATTHFTDDPPDPRRLWADTERAWQAAAPPQPSSMSSRDAQHALAVIRGMTSSTGAVVAAATTSLPERAQQGRDYDYRYAWIRDQCFAGRAVAAAGGGEVLERSLGFIAACLERDGDRLRPAYTVTGDPVPDQRPLDLPGYPGAPDVTVGNHANRQFQLDVLGETLCLFADADRLGVLDGVGVRAARTAARAIVRRHHEADAGIWELANRPWAHSRLTAAAGLRAAAARGLGGSDDDAWDALADHLLADVDRTSRHRTGRWCRSPGDAGTDAALLLPGLRGLVRPDDPRSRQTYCSVLEDLTEDGYVYRFRHRPGPLGEAEGAFLFCGFLLAMAAHQQGEPTLAARLYERNRAAVGPPGLFTEEFDVGQRQLRGNLPQTFVHAALLESAHVLTTPPGRNRP